MEKDVVRSEKEVVDLAGNKLLRVRIRQLGDHLVVKLQRRLFDIPVTALCLQPS